MNPKFKVILGVVFWTIWSLWAEYRITSLETRLNVHEAELHWQETPNPDEIRQ